MNGLPVAKLAAACRRLLIKMTVNKPTYLKLPLISVLIFIMAGTAYYIMKVSKSIESQYGEIAALGNYLSDNMQNKAENDAPVKVADGSAQLSEDSVIPGRAGNRSSSTQNTSSPSYASRPFSVGDVRMLNVMRLCYSGEFEDYEYVFINDVAFVLSNEDGGEVKLALDVEGLEGQNSQPYALTIPKGNVYYTARQGVIEPGAVFIVKPAKAWHDAYRVRVRVTSPNSIASDWFENPGTSFEHPCVPAG